MTTLLQVGAVLTVVYVLLYHSVTFFLLALSFKETSSTTRGRRARIASGQHDPEPLRPPVTVILPAYDEEPVIAASVRSTLGGTYEPLRVLVVDDGSTDGTLAALQAAYDLVELPLGPPPEIPTAELEGLWISRRDPRLRVVRKRNGGRSDAINAGIAHARHDLIVIADADSLIEPVAIERAVAAFTADPSRVVACGGMVRIANGGRVVGGELVEPRVRVRGIVATQTVEYLRGFLGSRIAWARLNALLIVSGAFGIFRREDIVASGGLSKETLGEDMELTMRIHHLLRPGTPQARVAFVPDAVCWTEAPVSLGALKSQRVRWHVGLIDNLRLHQGLIGRPRYGTLGILAVPYAVFFEAVAPVVFLVGAIVVGAGLLLGAVGPWVLTVMAIAVLVAQLQTAGALLVEEVGFRRYRSRDLLLLGLWSLTELFWYRPLTMLWRLEATARVLFGRRPGWGTIPRGAALAPDEPPEAQPQTR